MRYAQLQLAMQPGLFPTMCRLVPGQDAHLQEANLLLFGAAAKHSALATACRYWQAHSAKHAYRNQQQGQCSVFQLPLHDIQFYVSIT